MLSRLLAILICTYSFLKRISAGAGKTPPDNPFTFRVVACVQVDIRNHHLQNLVVELGPALDLFQGPPDNRGPRSF